MQKKSMTFLVEVAVPFNGEEMSDEAFNIATRDISEKLEELGMITQLVMNNGPSTYNDRNDDFLLIS